MFRYVIQRLLLFIPTFFIISLVAFGLSKIAPGDPVEVITKGTGGSGNTGNMQDKEASEQAYRQTAERLGLHLPVFYFSLKTQATPDTLYKVIRLDERENLQELIAQYGNWEGISAYYQQIKKVEKQSLQLPADSVYHESKKKIRNQLRELYVSAQTAKINTLLNNIAQETQQNPALQQHPIAAEVQQLQQNYQYLQTHATPMKNYIPSLAWNGWNNQYHRWITHFLRGDFGMSYIDNRPVSAKIWDAVRWTLLINVVSLTISYLLSIVLGVWSAVRKGTLSDQISTALLFVLYSLPSFWVATILIVFFTSPEYGMNFFPPGQVTDLPSDAPFMKRFFDIAYHLFLPILCITYGSLAFISRQMRGGMLSVLKQDYIRTARAKGLSEDQVVWKHAFRNSLFPIITLFAAIFPATIAGSVVIEVIYSIPGMGMLTLNSITARDWPVVFTVLLFAAVLTMIGNLVADLLYALVDPRVSFGKK